MVQDGREVEPDPEKDADLQGQKQASEKSEQAGDQVALLRPVNRFDHTHLDHEHDGRYDDRGQTGFGYVVKVRRQEQQRHDDQDGGVQAAQRGAHAAGVVHGAPAERTGAREPVHERVADVAQPDGQQLLGRVHGLAARERLADGYVLEQPDERQHDDVGLHGGNHVQKAHGLVAVLHRELGRSELGQARWHVADDLVRYVVRGPVAATGLDKHVAQYGAADDDYRVPERPDQPQALVRVPLDRRLLAGVRGADSYLSDYPQAQQEHDAPRPDDRVPGTNVARVPVQRARHLPYAGTGAAHADQVFDLGRDDQQRDGGREPGRHGTGHEVDDDAEATHPHGQLYDAREEAQQREVRRLATVERAVRHQRHDGRRSHGYVLTTADERVDERAQKRTVQAVLGWQTGQPGVRHRLRYHRQAYRHAGHHIAQPVLDCVTRQPCQYRQPPFHVLHGHHAAQSPFQPRAHALHRFDGAHFPFRNNLFHQYEIVTAQRTLVRIVATVHRGVRIFIRNCHGSLDVYDIAILRYLTPPF